jgi:hypothetical protein
MEGVQSTLLKLRCKFKLEKSYKNNKFYMHLYCMTIQEFYLGKSQYNPLIFSQWTTSPTEVQNQVSSTQNLTNRSKTPLPWFCYPVSPPQADSMAVSPPHEQTAWHTAALAAPPV